MIRPSVLSTALALAVWLGGGTLLAAATGSLPAASAQANAPAGGARGQRFGQMLLSLGLSDDQKTRIRAIVADARKQNATVTDPTARRANMRAAYAKIHTVLTPAQNAKLQAEMQAARANDGAAHS